MKKDEILELANDLLRSRFTELRLGQSVISTRYIRHLAKGVILSRYKENFYVVYKGATHLLTYKSPNNESRR